MQKFDIKNLSVEVKLIIVVSIISVIVMLMKFADAGFYKTIIEQLALFSNFKIFNYRIWQFVSYSFLHADVMHLLFNMLMLYLFSMLFFTFFNNKQFLKAYFLGGIAAGFFYFLVANIIGLQSYVVGASGAVMAVFFTVVGYKPDMRVNVIITTIPIYYIALLSLGLDLFQLFFDNAGGHLAHIGGSIFGFCYGKYLGGFSVSSLKKSKVKTNLRTVHNKINQTKNNSADNSVQKQIDVILDKISKSGYDSLTKEEKEFLFKQK
ncbi:rhomboid family protein [Paenimyroides viscosum]|jgi:membrane associated rhomboid family serine protease|uniref:Rhomboid family intramembrane serine protease n=1 Tax=Paenimyroides viscosum TaxID=2488729 RepID=A0A3P1B3Y5_9FLAO|nr:rhomboid family intramembrane serine protease [Paenimyroides viscosum]RRA95759.1 rhomboid family intramembrane serine protease [Paenimyroides viscosum]